MSSNFLVPLNIVSNEGTSVALINLNNVDYFKDKGSSCKIIFDTTKETVQLDYTFSELKTELAAYLYDQQFAQTAVDVAAYSLLPQDYHLEVEYTSTGECTITLPDVQRIAGRVVIITDTGGNAEVNNIIIKDTGGSELFRIEHDGDSLTLRANADSSKWYVY